MGAEDPDDPLLPLLEALGRSRFDEAAWQGLYHEMYGYVLGEAYRMTRGDLDAAEDLVQGLFFRLVKHAGFGELQNPRQFRAYVKRILRNLAYDTARVALTRAATRLDEVVHLLPPGDDGIRQAAVVEVEDSVRSAAVALNPDEEALLQLLIDGRSTAEIAEHLSIPRSRASVRVHRLRRRLAALIRDADTLVVREM